MSENSPYICCQLQWMGANIAEDLKVEFFSKSLLHRYHYHRSLCLTGSSETFIFKNLRSSGAISGTRNFRSEQWYQPLLLNFFYLKSMECYDPELKSSRLQLLPDMHLKLKNRTQLQRCWKNGLLFQHKLLKIPDFI